MKSRQDRRTELATKIQETASRYFDAVRKMQDHIIAMDAAKKLTGEFPNDAQDKLVVLHDVTQRLHIRIFRARADIMELALKSPFGDAPLIVPDSLPEDW